MPKVYMLTHVQCTDEGDMSGVAKLWEGWRKDGRGYVWGGKKIGWDMSGVEKTGGDLPVIYIIHLRKRESIDSMGEKTALVSLKLFINGNKRCHTTDSP